MFKDGAREHHNLVARLDCARALDVDGDKCRKELQSQSKVVVGHPPRHGFGTRGDAVPRHQSPPSLRPDELVILPEDDVLSEHLGCHLRPRRGDHQRPEIERARPLRGHVFRRDLEAIQRRKRALGLVLRRREAEVRLHRGEPRLRRLRGNADCAVVGLEPATNGSIQRRRARAQRVLWRHPRLVWQTRPRVFPSRFGETRDAVRRSLRGAVPHRIVPRRIVGLQAHLLACDEDRPLQEPLRGHGVPHRTAAAWMLFIVGRASCSLDEPPFKRG
mmetsp:Transcript_18656/g.63000  ORF Transcript_18656/g.63000 Transcript_18656/m.63000 type:complete len:274 (-) Transcript_18656:846-1667(-)